jgi:hypothetical protein
VTEALGLTLPTTENDDLDDGSIPRWTAEVRLVAACLLSLYCSLPRR